jgi:hypothetical protein
MREPGRGLTDAAPSFLHLADVVRRGLGARDFLLAANSPSDWQSLELVVREVAPALRPKPG